MWTLWFLTGMLLAQQPLPDPLSGGSGWAGAGLLGLVLGWLLLWHLPKKDEQILTLVESKDQALREQHEEFTATLKELVDEKGRSDKEQRERFAIAIDSLMRDFRQESSLERQACEKHFEVLSSTMTAAYKTLGDQLHTNAVAQQEHSRRNQQWLETLQVELRKYGVPAPHQKLPEQT